MSILNKLFNRKNQEDSNEQKKMASKDLVKLKELIKVLNKREIPIDRDYNELLDRIADSNDKELLPLLQSTLKAAEEFIELYQKAGLDKQPGAWILKANASEIISKSRFAVDKINNYK